MEKVKRFMELLDCDEQTAKRVIADDKAIDKGEKLFELTAEQQAESKKYRQGDRKPTVYKFDKRERKADNSKRELIEILTNALTVATNVTITNPERQIDFEYQNRKFRIVLSAPRG